VLSVQELKVRVKCPVCGYVFSNFTAFKTHYRKYHGHYCFVCGERCGNLAFHSFWRMRKGDQAHVIAYIVAKKFSYDNVKRVKNFSNGKTIRNARSISLEEVIERINAFGR